MDQLNEKGYTETKVWDLNDSSKHGECTDRILEVVNKKSQKDYTSGGGSTLLIVLKELPLFSRDNARDQAILNKLVENLKSITFKVEDVFLMLSLEPREFIPIKTQAH